MSTVCPMRILSAFRPGFACRIMESGVPARAAIWLIVSPDFTL